MWWCKDGKIQVNLSFVISYIDWYLRKLSNSPISIIMSLSFQLFVHYLSNIGWKQLSLIYFNNLFTFSWQKVEITNQSEVICEYLFVFFSIFKKI
jgi:hypothetical protein